jgi:hypothetical protein
LHLSARSTLRAARLDRRWKRRTFSASTKPSFRKVQALQHLCCRQASTNSKWPQAFTSNLMNVSMARDQQMSNAIAGFTNALAYGAARPVG